MPTQISIHSHTMNDKLHFSAGLVALQSANAVNLTFNSHEYHDHKKTGTFKVQTVVTLFNLDTPTAQCLSGLGRLDPEYRAKLVGIISHMLAEQEAETDGE